MKSKNLNILATPKEGAKYHDDWPKGYTKNTEMNTLIGPENAIALKGLMFTKLAISNCRRLNPTQPRQPWKARYVHNPPIWNHLTRDPCASAPQANVNEWPKQLGGVDTLTVTKLHPSM
jgi:hypothetical protein